MTKSASCRDYARARSVSIGSGQITTRPSWLLVMPQKSMDKFALVESATTIVKDG